MKRLPTALCCLLLLATLPLMSQSNRANIWYFGRNAGLDFNAGGPEALTDGEANTDEGTAVIAGTDGRLLFYTDGVRVWNRQHRLMPNGNGLWGSYTSTQSALILPKPGSPTLYYVFTTDGQGYYSTPATGDSANCACLAYSVVDISLDGGMGDVVQKNTVLHTPVTEKLSAVNHANGTDVWVVGHALGSRAFLAYLLTPGGLAPPVVSETGLLHEDGPGGGLSIGYLKLSPGGGKLALAARGLELFDFDNRTGRVGNPIHVEPNKEYLPPYMEPVKTFSASYGVEFSPNGKWLYATSWGRVYQFDISRHDSTTIARSRTILVDQNPTFTQAFAATQLATDGRIYISCHGTDYDPDLSYRQWNGRKYLSVISFPNNLGEAANLVIEGLDLRDRKGFLGLPNFNQSYFYPVDAELEMPNVFTPDGDGWNARFAPITQERVETASISIYNRWGQMVYQAGHLEGWDGTAGGQPAAAGVYYWQASYEGTNGRAFQVKGTVQLLR